VSAARLSDIAIAGVGTARPPQASATPTLRRLANDDDIERVRRRVRLSVRLTALGYADVVLFRIIHGDFPRLRSARPWGRTSRL
jgi:hypothetical protein